MKPAPVVVVVTLVMTALLAVGPAEAARRKRGEKSCKKGERFVADGTPVLGGPGLGFPVTSVTKQGRCARVLRSADEGSFALILVSDDEVGWVATGLVDAALSGDTQSLEAAGPVPLRPGDATTLYTVEPAALRDEPRFDASAARDVKAGEALAVLGRSPDAQWFFVASGEGAGAAKGWIPKYQTAIAAQKAGATPTAGAGAWAPQRAPFLPGGAAPAPPVDDAAAQAAALQAQEQARLAQLEAIVPPPAPAPVLLGRRQSVTAAVRGGYWRQDYASDAQDDPYARYVVQSGGGGAAIAYAYRADELGLIADVSGRLDQYGFSFAVPGGAAAYVPATQLGFAALAGWRLFGAPDVDLEAALGYGMDLTFVGDLVDAGVVVPAFATGVHHALKPRIAAKARIDEGRLGMFVVEAALPVGGYHLLPDPAERYRSQSDAFVPDDRRPGVAVPTPPTAPNEQVTTILHLGIGAEGRVGYVAALTDALLLDVALVASARQALIGGPGQRVGAYALATNVDVTAGVELGVGWQF